MKKSLLFVTLAIFLISGAAQGALAAEKADGLHLHEGEHDR
ncbi:MAG TPA: hypothetical protein VFG28_04055 [Syntrophales bacterium]|nr:hypothetical protein [Syntrophales bacterium]